MCSDEGRVFTIFEFHFEAFRRRDAELVQELSLLGAGSGDAAQAKLLAIGGEQNEIRALECPKQRQDASG